MISPPILVLSILFSVTFFGTACGAEPLGPLGSDVPSADEGPNLDMRDDAQSDTHYNDIGNADGDGLGALTDASDASDGTDGEAEVDPPDIPGPSDLGPDDGALDADVQEMFVMPATIGTPTRPATVTAPPAIPVGSQLPLLLTLPGYDYAAADLDAWFGFSLEAPDRGVILIEAEGTVDEGGSPFWNATDTCCDDDESGVDDMAYLADLLTEARDTLPVDPTRVFVFGHSNGGFMATRIACERPDLITHIAMIGGSGFNDPELCTDAEPVNITMINGTIDDIMPYAGDPWAPGAEAMLERWRVRGECDVALYDPIIATRDLFDLPGAETTVSGYRNCAGGVDVELWTVEGGDHYPDASAALMDALFDAWISSAPSTSAATTDKTPGP